MRSVADWSGRTVYAYHPMRFDNPPREDQLDTQAHSQARSGVFRYVCSFRSQRRLHSSQSSGFARSLAGVGLNESCTVLFNLWAACFVLLTIHSAENSGVF